MIPFHQIYKTPASEEYVARAIKDGKLSGDGAFTKKCESFLEELTGAPRVLLTSSCSIALDMCAMLIDAGPGDEILVPSYTFVTTAGAFYNSGAKPVFVDCCPDTLNMDVKHARSLVTERTKAIVPMHYGGVSCDMDAVMALADEHDLFVVEDAAQAFDAYKNGTHLGRRGHLATISFHDTKNVVCGEGGALIINDEKLIERAEIIREKGTNRKQFMDGQVDKYTWHDKGSSYVMSDILAAYLLGQFEAHSEIKNKRKQLYQLYKENLQNSALETQQIPEGCDPSYHLFYALLPKDIDRPELMRTFKDQGIQLTSHYVPLHTSPVGQTLGGRSGDLPVTESVSERLIRLPLYPDLKDSDVKNICEVLLGSLAAGSLQKGHVRHV